MKINECEKSWIFVNYDVVVDDDDDHDDTNNNNNDAEEQDTNNDNNSNSNIHDKHCLITKNWDK